MSSSNYVASLTGGGFSPFAFASASTEWGSVPDTFELEQEALRDRGVDYDRWRDVRLGYQPFTMQTLADDTSFANAAQVMLNYRVVAKRRQLATLYYSAGGTSKNFLKVKVLDVAPLPMLRSLVSGGSLYGYGASSPSSGVLAALWTLQLTQAGK
jgi:hypothetical protein